MVQSVNAHLTLATPFQRDYMGSEAAPEFVFDQGLYYPAAADYYGYYCKGIESSSELDDHHRFFGLDSQGLHYPGLQTESLPYVYFTPSYGYAQSPNTYRLYMPGSVVGIDGQYIGTDQYFTNPSYQQPVLSPAYIPAIIQSRSDIITNSRPGPLFTSNGASVASHRPSKYKPPLIFTNAAATSQRVTLGSSTLEPSKSSIHQSQTSAKLLKGSLANAVPSKQSLTHGALTASSVPHVTQAAHRFRNGRVSSVDSSQRITMPTNSASDLGTSDRGWATLDEHNKCPRTNRSKDESTSAIAVQAYTTKAGIVSNADQYNRDDFPVDYPDAKFFVIKSYTEDDVHKSIKYNVWSSSHIGNKKLDSAYEDAQRMTVGNPRECHIFLFFSVNTSGQFCGVAEMVGRVDFYKNMDFWQQNKWIGSFPVKWHILKDVPNVSLRHIILENYEYIPVTSSRDTQEIPYVPGLSMLKIFKNIHSLTSILDDFLYYEEHERKLWERKSRMLGRSLGTSLSSPVLVPSNGLTGTSEQLDGTSGKKYPIGSVDQSPNPDGEHMGVSKESPKDGRRMDDGVNHRPKTGQYLNGPIDQSLEADGTVSTGDVELPPDAGSTHQRGIVDKPPEAGGERTDGTFIQPSKKNGKLSNATFNFPARSDGKQPVDQRPKYDGKQRNGPIQPLKTDRNLTGASDLEISGEVSPRDYQVIPKSIAVDPSDAGGVNSVAKIDSLSIDSTVGEAESPSVPADVVTVGSMHINVSKHSESFRGIFTVGSLPVFDKGLKFVKKA